jgi:hypothetical protein
MENYNDKTGLWCEKVGTTAPCSNMLKYSHKKMFFFKICNFRASWYKNLQF